MQGRPVLTVSFGHFGLVRAIIVIGSLLPFFIVASTKAKPASESVQGAMLVVERSIYTLVTSVNF